MSSDFGKFGGEVLKKRRGKSLTRDELAFKAHCTRETIYLLETDQVQKPMLHTVLNISRALGISLDEVYGLKR